jgi:penicillin-binding protein 1A
VLKRFSYILAIIVMTLLIALGGMLALFYHYGSGLPDYQHLTDYKPPVVTRLYANDGHMFAEYAWEKRIYVPVQSIPKRVIQAFFFWQLRIKIFINIPELIFPVLFRLL